MDLSFYIETVSRWIAWLSPDRLRRPEVDGYLGGFSGGGVSRYFGRSFFAQEFPTPSPAHISDWLIDAAALGAILLIFLKIVDHFKRKPSLEQELEKLLKQIRAELNQLRHEAATSLTEVRGRVEGAHQRVDMLTHDLNNKLQRLPGEIVDLLHKTGVTPRQH